MAKMSLKTRWFWTKTKKTKATESSLSKKSMILPQTWTRLTREWILLMSINTLPTWRSCVTRRTQPSSKPWQAKASSLTNKESTLKRSFSRNVWCSKPPKTVSQATMEIKKREMCHAASSKSKGLMRYPLLQDSHVLSSNSNETSVKQK